jgi:hypothetical protein
MNILIEIVLLVLIYNSYITFISQRSFCSVILSVLAHLALKGSFSAASLQGHLRFMISSSAPLPVLWQS